MPARKSTRKQQPGGQNNILGAVIVACILGIGYLVSQGVIDLSRFGIEPAALGIPTSPAAAPSAGGAGDIQVFFTTPSLVYPDVPKNRTPPPHELAIVADIDAAARSVDMATYEYNLTSISQALARAKRRGVRVRLALDRENLDDPVMAKWAGVVQAAKIPVTWEETDAFLHSKFIIIDGQTVWTGSWNATTNDTYRNNNNLLRITAPAIIANYQAEFDQMAESLFGTKKTSLTPNPLVQIGTMRIENYFSPKDKPRPQIVEEISRARQSVDFLAFSYTSDDIGDAMIARQRAGVPVRGVFEKRNAQGIGSEFERLTKGKVDVLVDGNCYTMHHKVIIIDGRVVITGSYNFTGRAEDVNDENLIIIDDPAIAQLYEQEFERVYRQAQNPTSCG
ncbi:FAM83 family protein [Oscillochloris sp. ZM17-4]|uniref:phospholipase D-like domain-containing protein n=1 Tax=Oscillochloris sp. ZM17-4 TaxID=2866714 RepID=UPI001C73DCBD|nr:phospholipase D-like domain-containing protein [Oscillochloris sp. ZM17-4]MBX0329447.1 FAM83 family protein [Oscillochloris sp. ZM17-4]